MRSMATSLVGWGTPAFGTIESVLTDTTTLRVPSALTPLRVMNPWMSPPCAQEPPHEFGIHIRPSPYRTPGHPASNRVAGTVVRISASGAGRSPRPDSRARRTRFASSVVLMIAPAAPAHDG